MFSRKSFLTRSFSARSWYFQGIEGLIGRGPFATLAVLTATVRQTLPQVTWSMALPSKTVLLDNRGRFSFAWRPSTVTIFQEEYYASPRYFLAGVFA